MARSLPISSLASLYAYKELSKRSSRSTNARNRTNLAAILIIAIPIAEPVTSTDANKNAEVIKWELGIFD